jgi:polyisoprenoid-binding protein YceI
MLNTLLAHQLPGEYMSLLPVSLLFRNLSAIIECAGTSLQNRRRTPHFVVFGLIGLLFSSLAMAQTQYRIDPDKSQVQFMLAGSHEVDGQFHVRSGDISFDQKTGEMKGTVLVDAGSGTSNDKSRDKKMTKDELKAEMFPTITFSPRQFTGTLNDSGDSTLQVQGTFTLIGKPHDIAVPMTVHADGNQCTAKGSFTIPYVEWGMKNPSFFTLRESKEVKVNLTFTGTLSK